MAEKYIGSIVSTQLGELGKRQYGYIALETSDKKNIKVKVAAFTIYDTLDVGAHVEIVTEPLGTILTAKTIKKL